MDAGNSNTRREWLALGLRLGAVPFLSPAALSALQQSHHAVRSGDSSLHYFDEPTAGEVIALADGVIPSTDTPGARDAGVVYFIDRALAGFDKDKQQLFKDGLSQAQSVRARLFPDSASIAGLKPQQLTQLLQAIEKEPFFELLRQYTIVGFLASPEWGGNRDGAGWKAIGFEDGHAFQPPFGWYDTPGNYPEGK